MSLDFGFVSFLCNTGLKWLAEECILFSSLYYHYYYYWQFFALNSFLNVLCGAQVMQQAWTKKGQSASACLYFFLKNFVFCRTSGENLFAFLALNARLLSPESRTVTKNEKSVSGKNANAMQRLSAAHPTTRRNSNDSPASLFHLLKQEVKIAERASRKQICGQQCSIRMHRTVCCLQAVSVQTSNMLLKCLPGLVPAEASGIRSTSKDGRLDKRQPQRNKHEHNELLWLCAASQWKVYGGHCEHNAQNEEEQTKLLGSVCVYARVDKFVFSE